MCVLACRLELRWSQDKSMRKVFTHFVCVLMMWSDWGWSLGEGASFILVEGLKIEFFGIIRWRKQFGTLFVNLVYT